MHLRARHPSIPTGRPIRRAFVGFLPVAVIALVAACGANPDRPTPSPTSAGQVPPSTLPSPARSLTPPSAPASGSAPTARASTMTQTDTAWGRIWDGVPAGFPRFPGATAADDAGPEPVSAAYAVSGTDVRELATWMQSAMETATYSTEALSGPLEDGGYVLDSVGDRDCRLETRITPQGTLIIVTVRYGAACPAP